MLTDFVARLGWLGFLIAELLAIGLVVVLVVLPKRNDDGDYYT